MFIYDVYIILASSPFIPYVSREVFYPSPIFLTFSSSRRRMRRTTSGTPASAQPVLGKSASVNLRLPASQNSLGSSIWERCCRRDSTVGGLTERDCIEAALGGSDLRFPGIPVREC
eukprot:GEMP01071627.1.p1 GENE.GEMP01071627.1~~GEMP01071627.1.p1  ORF type:complete len:116 (-),score=7.94 GEMP01071627.1:336-683(-)